MTGTATVLRGNALDLPLDDGTVDLIVTSPPYFGLRSYQDGGEHYAGQIGSEATPAEFVDALIAATAEMVRVLKPSGSLWVNLGDKYASGGRTSYDVTDINGARGGKRAADGFQPKTLLGIPWRYALRCIDELGLILRAEVIWSKPNGLPESVTDRVRRSHEQWFCFQQQSGGQVVEPSAHGLPLCSLCGRPADTRATLIARLHELDPSIQDADLSNQVWTDQRVQGEGGVRTEQPGVVGLGGTTVPLPVPGDADLIEDAGDLVHDGQVSVVDDDAEVRAAGAAVAEGDRPLSVDDSGEPGEVCSCSHPLIIDDEPWIPQEVAAEIMQLVADGDVDPQQAADFLSGDYARSHSTWFHFTLNPRYYSAVDEIREAHGDRLSGGPSHVRPWQTDGEHRYGSKPEQRYHSLGKLPGSVWSIPTQPLRVPDHLGVDHFAAFPMEWPRRIIRGWSPSGVCVECGEGRRPVTHKKPMEWRPGPKAGGYEIDGTMRKVVSGTMLAAPETTITGYACACPEPTAPTTPGVVLDPFGGTGTTALVAKALGRHGITVDMSADYCRLAEWRINDEGELARAMQVEKPREQIAGQSSLLDLLEGA